MAFHRNFIRNPKQQVMKKASSFIILLFTIGCVRAQSNFNYNSYIEFVKQNHLIAHKARNSGLYGEALYKASRGVYDPQISASVDQKYFNSKEYYTLGGAEVKQALYTSQYLKFGYEYGQGLNIGSENETPVNGLPYMGIQASLLQGLMFDKNRAEVLKGKYYKDFYKAEERIQLNELLYASSNLYADYLYAQKLNYLYGYFANLAGQRLIGIEQLSAIGERPAVDTLEAAIFLQGRELDKKAGELEVTKKYTDLLVFIQDRKQGAESFAVTDSIELMYELAAKTVLNLLSEKSNDNPFIQQYNAKQKVLNTEMRLKREMIKPVLDVKYNFLQTDNSSGIRTFSTNNYKWGASFTVPLFLRKSRNEYRMAKLVSDNNVLDLQNKRNQINFKRSLIQTSIGILSEQIITAARSAKYSKQLVEAERLKFTNGESSLFLLNARESKWLETELKLAEYKLKYIKSFLDLVYINGLLDYKLNN